MLIDALKSNHIQEVIHLCDALFGRGFLTEDYISQYIDSESNIGLVITDNKKLVGYILIDILTFKKFINIILIRKEWFIEKFKDYNNVCIVKQVAVTEEHQNKGIATKLIEEALLRTPKVYNVACSLAWRKGNKVSLKSSLLQNGFGYATTIDNYWYDDSISKNYNCAYCGCPPCSCGSEVYAKLH